MKCSLPVFLLLLAASTFTGCLQDPIDGPQVFSRVVSSPAGMYFFSPPTSWNGDLTPQGATGDLTVKWQHAATDTQLNFKAYYLRLYASTLAKKYGDPDDLTSLVQTARVLKVQNKIDTSFTFKNIPYGRYTVMVNGEQFADSLTLSVDTAIFSNNFDPRPLKNPTNLRATSAGPNTIKLQWDLPPTDGDSGLYKYRVFYLDTAATLRAAPRDSAYLHAPIYANRGETSALVTIQVAATSGGATPQQERSYKFWVLAERVDSVLFHDDSSVVTWAGADRLGSIPAHDSTGTVVDTSAHGYHHSIFIGSINGSYSIIDDSVDNGGELRIAINGNAVTLTPNAGAKLLSHYDVAAGLDSIFYRIPYTEASAASFGYAFTTDPVTLTTAAPGMGAVLYLEIPDPILNKPEYARIYIAPESNGTFVVNGTIFVQASFQPGKTDDGSTHLPYY